MNVLEESDLPLAEKAAFALNRINVAMRAEDWEVTGELGINPTQKQILLLLSQTGTDLRPSEIAANLVISKPTVSDSIATLVKKGLLTKEKVLEDGRAIAVRLTPKGKRIAKRLNSSTQMIGELIGHLAKEEQSTLYSYLLKMIRQLQDSGRIPVTRMCNTCRYFQPNAHDSKSRPHHCDLVGVPLGSATIRIDCPEHELVTEDAS